MKEIPVAGELEGKAWLAKLNKWRLFDRKSNWRNSIWLANCEIFDENEIEDVDFKKVLTDLIFDRKSVLWLH